jgi:hypothetical protein
VRIPTDIRAHRWQMICDPTSNKRLICDIVYRRAIVPIGIMFSLSLICGNLAYLYLSVSFIQMLKVRTNGGLVSQFRPPLRMRDATNTIYRPPTLSLLSWPPGLSALPLPT